MAEKEFTWDEAPVFRDGEVFFPSVDIQDRVLRREALKGVEVFESRMVYPENSSLFSSYEVTVIREDEAAPVFIKRFPAGGHQDLDSREPYILQEDLSEFMQDDRL